jgi:hypothetical protein
MRQIISSVYLFYSMSYMKRIITSVGFIGLMGFTSFIYASTASLSHNQTPATEHQFELSIGPLFLQPSSTLLDYAVLGFPLPVQTPHWKVSAVRPGYSTGFDLAGRYYIPNTNYDAHLSWDHLKTKDSNTTQAGSSQFVVVLFQAGPSAGQSLNNPSTHAKATAKFNYDVVNLDVGRYFDYYDNIQLRLYLGLSGAQIKENLSATFRDNAATFNINTTNNSKFTGIGPLFGIDGKYQLLGSGFGISGSAILSALIGTLDPITSFTSSSPELSAGGITSNFQTISPANSTQVVPAFDGKLGLNYAHVFNRNTSFSLALGYEYAVYFNSLVAYNPSTVFGNVNLGTIALSSLGKSVSNFSVQGPFLNVVVNFG